MVSSFIVTGVAGVLLLVHLWLTGYEATTGKRVFLSAVRGWCDTKISRMSVVLRRIQVYVFRYIITLSWYYSIHTFLKISLHSLAGMYGILEHFFMRNRARAREIRRERKQSRSHLTELAEHQAETKLTPGEAKRRKDKALKG
jgi:hypothetical protein